MKLFNKNKFLIVAVVITFISCNTDDETPTSAQEYTQIINLNAPMIGGQGQAASGVFTKFDFSTSNVTSSETDWDIAFRGTTIIVNGGSDSGTIDEPLRNGAAAAYIQNNIFSEVETVNENLFIQDSANGLAIPTGSGNGWYNYTGSPDHLIVPIPGKTLVFRTRDFKYAKVEILSYYKDFDSSIAENARYYTFNYLYQPDENLNSF